MRNNELSGEENTINKVYSLIEIANWQLEPDEYSVAIPRLQRGLVWSAVKMEVLWDSIMRGIPIGSFIVSKREGESGQDRNPNIQAAEYLIDGQQRSAAITMGFRDFPLYEKDDQELPVLWIDLLPPQSKETDKSRRRFWFKVTTRAHPWGYKYVSQETEGKNTVFSAGTRQESVAAVSGIQESKQDIGKRPLPSELWPWEAARPVPFTYLRKAYEDFQEIHTDGPVNPVDFWGRVVELVEKSSSNWHENKWKNIRDQVIADLRDNPACLDSMLEGFKSIHNYSVVALRAPDSLIQETEGGLAVLFERINVQGEIPKPEELAYSVLKTYWPEIADIDKAARGRMFEYRMAVLALQVYACRKDPKKWNQTITVPYIRSLMSEKYADIAVLREFIVSSDDGNSKFAKACDQVDQWLGFDPKDEKRGYQKAASEWGILTFHRTAIAQKRADIYKLLLLLALKEMPIDLSDRQITSLTMLISWFSNNIGSVSRRIYEAICEGDGKDLIIIKKAIADSVDKGELLIPCPPKQLEDLLSIQTIDKDSSDAFNHRISSSFWWESLSCIWSPFGNMGHEFLLYTQRKYMKNVFSDYDPSQRDLWESYNRPWDIDHILPRDWLHRRQRHTPGPFMGLGERLRDSLGNTVAIPFSVNRSKSNDPPTEEYCDSILKHEGVMDKDKVLHSYTERCNYDADYNGENDARACKFKEFVGITIERFEELYENAYEALSFGQWFDSSAEYSKVYKERQEINDTLSDYEGMKVCYLNQDKLHELKNWADAHFCQWMYFLYEREDGLKIFLSHEKENGNIEYYVGILQQSGIKEDIAEKLRKTGNLNIKCSDDKIQYAYCRLDSVEEALKRFQLLNDKGYENQ